MTALASWLVTELPPAPGRGSRVRCLSDRGAAGACPLHWGGHPLPPRHSLEFFGHAYVCLAAWQCCPVQSAFSGLHGGEARGGGGSPCRFAEPCTCRIVWSVPGSSPPVACRHPTHWHIGAAARGGGCCFKSSPKIWPVFPTGLRKRSWYGHRPPTPRESKLRIDGSCPPPAPPPAKGPGKRWSFSLKARTWRCVA